MASEASKIDPKLPINGLVYNATEDGFERLVTDANRGHKLGYRLAQVVELEGGKRLGALFFRRSAVGGSGDSSLFGE